jgi:hypothetical protein
MDRRVAITGIGIVSPLGSGREAFWEAVLAGASGIAPVAAFPLEALPCRLRRRSRFSEGISFPSKNWRMDDLFALAGPAAAGWWTTRVSIHGQPGRRGMILVNVLGAAPSERFLCGSRFGGAHRWPNSDLVPTWS